ncbi:oxidoreductase, partial [Staphylococcus pseudintermedius]
AYGKPGVRTPLWLQTCIDKEMTYPLNEDRKVSLDEITKKHA